MRGGADANRRHGQGGGPFSKQADIAKILCGQNGQRSQRDEEHREHPGVVNRHAFLDERHGDAAAINASHDGDPIDDERRHHDLLLGHAKLLVQIVRQPEKVKPPDAVGDEFTPEKRPGLAVAKQPGAAFVAEFIWAGGAFAESQNQEG